MRRMPVQPKKKVTATSKAAPAKRASRVGGSARAAKPASDTPRTGPAVAAKRASRVGGGARAVKGASDASRTDPAVAAFMKELDHPLKKEVEVVRRLILGVAPEIREGIKWNAPSFRTTEHFATFNLRAKDRIRLILHLGAKVKATAKEGIEVADPSGLLEWLARDRCLVSFSDENDVEAKRGALEAVVREWIRWV